MTQDTKRACRQPSSAGQGRAGQIQKAAIATCARAALSSLANTHWRSGHRGVDQIAGNTKQPPRHSHIRETQQSRIGF